MNNVFTPIHDQRLSDRVTERLLNAIRNGDLPLGSRLPPEGVLAEQMGISRGILRESLTVLEARGYLKRTPKEGTVILSIRGDELGQALSNLLQQATYRDLLEFREALECRAVCSIVEHATNEQIAGLAKAAEKTKYDSDADQPLDHYFHYQLTEISGNSLFSAWIDAYYELISEMKAKSLHNPRRYSETQKEHLEIVQALRERDSAKAKQAVINHLKAVCQSINQEKYEETQ